MLDSVPMSSLCPRFIPEIQGEGKDPAFQALRLVERKVGVKFVHGPKPPSRLMKSDCRAVQNRRVIGPTTHLTDEETEA